MSEENKDFAALRKLVKKAGLLGLAAGVIAWDAEVNTPKNGLKFRGPQMENIMNLAHELSIDPKIGELITKLEEQKKGLTSEQLTYLQEVKFEYDRSTKVPIPLVEKSSQLRSKAHPIWVEAKNNNDFSLFLPVLKEIFQNTKDIALAIAPNQPAYETLLQDDDWGLTLEEIKTIMQEVKEAIVPLIKKRMPTITMPTVPKEKQQAFTKPFLEKLGYDFSVGRLDEAEHPFTTESGRITTHYYEDNFFYGFMAGIHEFGHGLYEMNLPIEYYGEPLGIYRSLSVHESQSRFWENNLARTHAFWKPWYEQLQEAYNLPFSMEEMVAYLNRIEPSLIRVDADELTYPLHIILRVEIEVEVFENKLTVEDIPKAWNTKMQSYLGITPPNDTKGCLQDVHWADLLLGYFPTYLIGSVLAAQIEVAMRKDLDIGALLLKKDYKPIREWLYEKIHKYGRKLPTHELIKQATGKALSSEDYITYLTKKYS